MKTLDEIADSVAVWHAATFPLLTSADMALKVLEETVELAMVVGVSQERVDSVVRSTMEKPTDDLRSEMADVFLALCGFARCTAFGIAGLRYAVSEKFAENRARAVKGRWKSDTAPQTDPLLKLKADLDAALLEAAIARSQRDFLRNYVGVLERRIEATSTSDTAKEKV